MKKLTCLIVVCTMMGLHGQPVAAPTDEPGFQLTVELRDGSRVIGQALDDTLSFHSATLGDMKLSWASIRAIEYTADTDTAHLTATNGDGITVELSGDSLGLQTGFGKTDLPVKLIKSIKVLPSAKPNVSTTTGATKEADLRLTIELRDGSHLVGKGMDDTLNFHSTAMGDLKLTWAGIRSIEYATTGTDSAQLTATNGDVYEVQFAAPTVGVETSFGKTELPVKLIRSIRVSQIVEPGQLPMGLVALWTGDGNGVDSVGGHNAIVPPGITYAPGKVGQGFSFDGREHRILVPNAPELNFDDKQDFSITAWIQPEQTNTTMGVMSIVDKRFEVSYNQESPGYEFALENGRIHARILRTAIGPGGSDLRDGQFHHVAVTVQRNSPEGGHLYVDGRPVFTFETTALKGDLSNDQPLRIGNHCDPSFRTFFKGIINQVAIYNRALSAAEVDALYEEQSNGEPPALPSPAPPAPPFSPSVHRQDEAVFGGKMKPGSIGGATD